MAEKYPESSLLPPPGTPQRTECYQWTSYVLTELDAPLWTIAKHRFGLPKERRVPAVINSAAWEVGVALKILASGIGNRRYLVGSSFTVADILAGHTLLWAKSARLPLESDNLEEYLEGLCTRGALLRARERSVLNT